MVDGEVRVGLDDAALEALAADDGVAKCGVRDLGRRRARGGDGATTVAATAHLAARRRHPACSPPAGSAACTAARARRFDESADLGDARARPASASCARA